MNRTKGILTAGTLTGLVLVTLLALGFRGVNSQAEDATAVPEIIVQPVVSPAADGSQAAPGDQSYTQQLETALTSMQAREATYRTQLDAANQTIVQLQDQINADRAAQTASASANSAYAEYEDDDDHDEHEAYGFYGEHEEHEEHGDD